MMHKGSTLDPREDIVAYLPQMRAFAISLTRNSDTADDLVQDAVVKAWRKFHTYEQGTNLQAWLFTIVRNTFYSDIRRQQRQPTSNRPGVLENLSVKPTHDARLAMRDFQRIFDKLPTEQREALVLVCASGLSYEDAAAMCGVPVGTIKSRINRGRARLTELMDVTCGADLLSEDTMTSSIVTATQSGRSFTR